MGERAQSELYVLRLEGGWRLKAGDPRGSARPDLDDRSWGREIVPGPWERRALPGYDGVAWYRTRFHCSLQIPGKIYLLLGRIHDADETYVNGELVGRTGDPRHPDPAGAAIERIYEIPRSLLHPGPNLLAIRVGNAEGPGGLVDGPLRLLAGVEAERLASLQAPAPAGCAAANFGMGAQLARDGHLFARVVADAVIAGEGLREVGTGSLALVEPSRGIALDTGECAYSRLQLTWPMATFAFGDPRLREIECDGEIFAPIGFRDARIATLPAVMAVVRIANNSAEERELELVWRFRERLGAGIATPGGIEQSQSRLGYVVGSSGRLALAADGRVLIASPLPGFLTLRALLRIPPGQDRRVRLALAYLDPRGSPMGGFHRPGEVVEQVFRGWRKLQRATATLDDAFPRCGDPLLDEAARWYASSAALATRIERGGRCLLLEGPRAATATAFWSSYAHLILWTDIERAMLASLAAVQGDDGLVPAELEPQRMRADDLESTLLFCLRVFRLWEWKGRTVPAGPLWDAVVRAIDRLVALDVNRDGYPDLTGEEARRAARAGVPFLVAAALERAVQLAGEDRYQGRVHPSWGRTLERAREALAAGCYGGLEWNGTGFAREGSARSGAVPAQYLGWFFGTAGLRGRVAKAVAALDARRTEVGIPASSASGVAARARVWPYLNFADALGRMRIGLGASGLTLLRGVARADLFADGAHLPSSSRDARDGTPLGIRPSAAGADFLGACTFGVLGLRRQGDLLEMTPLLDSSSGRRLRIAVLPEGAISIESRWHEGRWILRVGSQIARPLRLRYQLVLAPDELAPLRWSASGTPGAELGAEPLPTGRSAGLRCAALDLRIERGQPDEVVLIRRR